MSTAEYIGVGRYSSKFILDSDRIISRHSSVIIHFLNRVITVKFGPPDNSNVILRLLSIIHNTTVLILSIT